ncbi:hypothetical protein BDA99DRAFT_561321 [Phascolomyces articulosus]|uniref:SAM domain-containing protein n=1 Tax=Phascolomyces articulosus TaxID=60185 RepID=A0AAD5JXM2_9FUNG|nr:hypothetical protein BDA99DRAFT_561321 [Phascolomyces articulosus]
MIPSARPRSEIFNRGNHATDSEQGNGWREDLQHYERNLEEMTSVNLDQNFKEELQHVDQWFRFLSETERTATVYTLLQHSSQVQIRFFISILQQLTKRDSLHSFLTPANPEQDMQSQLAGAVAKMEMEANQRLRAAATIRRPPSAGNDRRTVDNRHSFALGDTEDYSRLFGPMGSNSSSVLNLNGTTGASVGGSAGTGSIIDDFGRAPIPRTPTTRSSLFANRSRPRSVIEGDSSLLFPSAGSSAAAAAVTAGNSSNWLQPPPSRSSLGGGNRLSMAAERPKSADVSMWALPSFDEENKKRASTTGGWGVPSAVQFADVSPRDEWSRHHPASHHHHHHHVSQSSASHRAGRNSSNIPGTVPESDERNTTAVDSANLVLSSFDTTSSRSPVPSVSASAPFNSAGRPRSQHQQQHHLVPPGMEKHYGQFLNPTDATGVSSLDDHDYLSDHSEASNVSMDRNGYKRHGANQGKSPAPSSSGSRTPKENNNNSNKKSSEMVNMELLEDVPAWLRMLRLHKYNHIFETMKWQDMIKLSNDELEAKGVAALGARNKMLRIFETVQAHCDANNIKY